MRGKILGVNGDQGVIVAEGDEGDERFTFALEEWKDAQTPPKRGMAVDFVGHDGVAREIYPALGSGLGGLSALGSGLGGGSEIAGTVAAKIMDNAGQNDLLQQVIAKIKAFPHMVLAFVTVFVFFFMSYASFGFDGNALNRQLGSAQFPNTINTQTTLSGLNDELDLLRTQSDVMTTQIKTMIANRRVASRNSRSVRSAQRIAELERVLGVIQTESWLFSYAYLFWFIPLAALAVIGLHWFGRHSWARLSGVALGVISVSSGIFIQIWQSLTLSAVPLTIRNSVAPLVEDSFALEWGGWLIVLCGLGMLALSARPLRKPELMAAATA